MQKNKLHLRCITLANIKIFEGVPLCNWLWRHFCFIGLTLKTSILQTYKSWIMIIQSTVSMFRAYNFCVWNFCDISPTPETCVNSMAYTQHHVPFIIAFGSSAALNDRICYIFIREGRVIFTRVIYLFCLCLLRICTATAGKKYL